MYTIRYVKTPTPPRRGARCPTLPEALVHLRSASAGRPRLLQPRLLQPRRPVIRSHLPLHTRSPMCSCLWRSTSTFQLVCTLDRSAGHPSRVPRGRAHPKQSTQPFPACMLLLHPHVVSRKRRDHSCLVGERAEPANCELWCVGAARARLRARTVVPSPPPTVARRDPIHTYCMASLRSAHVSRWLPYESWTV